MTTTRITLRDDQATALLWADAIRAPNVNPLVIPYALQYDARGEPCRTPLTAGFHGSLTKSRISIAGEVKPKTRQAPRLLEDWARAGVWQRGARHVQPEAWAIPPGRLGVVVVDVDDPSMLPMLLEMYGETSVWVLSPSGGTHLYYRAPTGPAPASRTGVRGPHSYDIKADGATVHAPGSRHHRCPGRYTADAPGIVDGALRRGATPLLKASELWHAMPVFRSALADLEWETWHPAKERPVDLEEVILEDTPALRDWLLNYMVDIAGPAVENGGGHDHTRWLINRIGDFGATLEVTLELFAEWNLVCEPPWPAQELEGKVRHYYTARNLPIGWRAREMGLVGDDESGALEEDAADDLMTEGEQLTRLAAMVR